MDLSTIKGNQNTTKLIQYLKNSIEQYPALSYLEERKMIEENKYDREKLERLLFMHNIKIVFATVKNWKTKVNEYDDVVQDALVGLADAAHRFDPWKQAHDPKTKEPKFMPDGSPAFVKFTTYVMPWINKKILERFYKKNAGVELNSMSIDTVVVGSTNSKNDGRESSTVADYIHEYIDPSIGKDTTLSSKLLTAENIKICKDLYSKLEEDSSLSVTDRAVFADMFYNGATEELAVRKYKMSKHDIRNLKSRILKKFKDILEDNYGIYSYAEMA